MKHFTNLRHKDIFYELAGGEYFTYVDADGYFRKGLKVAPSMMVPVGLRCRTLECAKSIY